MTILYVSLVALMIADLIQSWRISLLRTQVEENDSMYWSAISKKADK